MLTVESIKLSQKANDKKCGEKKQYQNIFLKDFYAEWMIRGQDEHKGEQKVGKDFTNDFDGKILRRS